MNALGVGVVLSSITIPALAGLPPAATTFTGYYTSLLSYCTRAHGCIIRRATVDKILVVVGGVGDCWHRSCSLHNSFRTLFRADGPVSVLNGLSGSILVPGLALFHAV